MFEKDDSVRGIELFSESPWVGLANAGWIRLSKESVKLVLVEMWKRLEELWCVPGCETAAEIVLWAENANASGVRGPRDGGPVCL